MVYEIGICDDEEYQVKLNCLYMKEIASRSNLELKYHGFTSGEKLLAYVNNNNLDILFLDIDLGEARSGIELAAELSKRFPNLIVIFVTGHREFAGEAFEVEAMGYLVKPFDIEKMESILRKAILQATAIKGLSVSHKIVITDENIKKKINTMEINYVQRQISKSVIRTEKRSYNVYETITSLYERLGENFIRVNQGEVVNSRFISEISGNIVKLKNGMEMSIGRTYRKDVISKYFGTSITNNKGKKSNK